MCQFPRCLLTLRHRILNNFRAESEGVITDSIIDELLSAVATPKSGM